MNLDSYPRYLWHWLGILTTEPKENHERFAREAIFTFLSWKIFSTRALFNIAFDIKVYSNLEKTWKKIS